MEPVNHVNSKVIRIGAAFLSVLIFAYAGAAIGRAKSEQSNESLHESLTTILRAVDKADGKTLTNYLSDQEAAQTGANAKNLSSFLAGPYAERMRDFKPDPTLKVIIDEPGRVAAQRTYHAKDGRMVATMFIVQLADDGPRLTPLLCPLSLTYFATWRTAGEGSSPETLRKAWAKGSAIGAGPLAKLGLAGMVVNEKVDRFYTWAEWTRKSMSTTSSPAY